MVDCHKSDQLCDKLRHHHGTFYFADAEEVGKQGLVSGLCLDFSYSLKKKIS